MGGEVQVFVNVKRKADVPDRPEDLSPDMFLWTLHSLNTCNRHLS